ncbi:MAG: hypothetical protein WEA31_00360 [Pirellulales bacterium]
MTNPYASPESSDASAAQDGRIARRIDTFAVFAWPIVFGVNLIVPALFGAEVTDEQGALGMMAACIMWLVLGWSLCLLHAPFARRLIVGSVLTALSQVFPIIHLIAGMFAIDIATALGLHLGQDHPVGNVTSEFGGFFVTLLVGGILIACAVVAGLVAGVVLPSRWMDGNAAVDYAGSDRQN